MPESPSLIVCSRRSACSTLSASLWMPAINWLIRLVISRQRFRLAVAFISVLRAIAFGLASCERRSELSSNPKEVNQRLIRPFRDKHYLQRPAAPIFCRLIGKRGRGQPFIRTHNEPLIVAAICVRNED